MKEGTTTKEETGLYGVFGGYDVDFGRYVQLLVLLYRKVKMHSYDDICNSVRC